MISQKTINISLSIGFALLLIVYIITVATNGKPVEHSDEFNRLLKQQAQRDSTFQSFQRRMDSLENIKRMNDIRLDSFYSKERAFQKNIDILRGGMNKLQIDIKTFKGRVNFQDSSKTSHKDFYKGLK